MTIAGNKESRSPCSGESEKDVVGRIISDDGDGLFDLDDMHSFRLCQYLIDAREKLAGGGAAGEPSEGL